MRNIIIIGAGAAGMMAAYGAASCGAKVTVLDKNEKSGKKIYITGKGRCNVTNACDIEDLFSHVLRNEKFLYSAFFTFSNQSVMDFFESSGCPLKIERGDRVFPTSDHSSDIIRCLEKKLYSLGVTIKLHHEVKELLIEKTNDSTDKVTGVILKNGDSMRADAVIVATGGLSYPSTGSTGDGYRFAKNVGHTVTDLSPALVPLLTKGDTAKRLQGLSLKNVEATLYDNDTKKVLYSGFGEMLFTHNGVSGPLVLSASSMYDPTRNNNCSFIIDFKPALSKEQLDKRLLRDFSENLNKQFKNVLGGLFPAKLIPIMVEQSSIAGETKVNEITKEQRLHFIELIKHFSMPVSGMGDFAEAIITRGGIKTKEIDPSTMASKKCNDLYFAGEVLDLDAVTGGFNLQIAWSTGYLAGISAAEEK